MRVDICGGMMEVKRERVYNVECTQIITIPCSSGACHAEGRQIERTNGNWGDAVWSNLLPKEAWRVRERQGEKMCNPHHKKREICRFTSVCRSTFDTFRIGAELRE